MDVVVVYEDESLFDDGGWQISAAVTNGAEYMRVVRVGSTDDLPSECEPLGTYEEILGAFDAESGLHDESTADPDKLARYNSIYQRSVPYTDEDGSAQVYTPPQRFGGIA